MLQKTEGGETADERRCLGINSPTSQFPLPRSLPGFINNRQAPRKLECGLTPSRSNHRYTSSAPFSENKDLAGYRQKAERMSAKKVYCPGGTAPFFPYAHNESIFGLFFFFSSVRVHRKRQRRKPGCRGKNTSEKC